jgi:hypothetical protein
MLHQVFVFLAKGEHMRTMGVEGEPGNLSTAKAAYVASRGSRAIQVFDENRNFLHSDPLNETQIGAYHGRAHALYRT